MRSNNDDVRKEIVFLLKEGCMDQIEIFNRLYPSFRGHYSRLRDLISTVKNEGVS